MRKYNMWNWGGAAKVGISKELKARGYKPWKSLNKIQRDEITSQFENQTDIIIKCAAFYWKDYRCKT